VDETISFIKFKLCFNSFSLLPYGNQLYMIHNYFLHNHEEVDETLLENQFYLAALTGVPKNNPSSVEKLLNFYKSNFDIKALNTKLISQYDVINIPDFTKYFSARSAYSKILLNIQIRKETSNLELTCKEDVQKTLNEYIFPPVNLSNEYKERVGNKVFKNTEKRDLEFSAFMLSDVITERESNLERSYKKLIELVTK